MARAIDETNRRREKQVAYNLANGIDPTPLRKKISDITDGLLAEEEDTEKLLQQKPKRDRDGRPITPIRKRPDKNSSYDDLIALVVELDAEMKSAAEQLNFELAARLRDEISELKYTIRQIDKI
jgi:excinuclease ABC subunit B